jgi:hypothetical protein
MTYSAPFRGDWAARTAPYIQTETLRYADGREVVSDTKARNMAPARAVSVTYLAATISGAVRFWFDHDPRIVAVSYTYAPA